MTAKKKTTKKKTGTAKANHQKARLKKKQFLELYSDIEKYLGVRGRVLSEMGVSRQLFKKWMDTDEEFKQQVEELEEQFTDFAEITIKDEAFLKRNPKMMESLMKILLRKRGYDNSQKIEVSGGINMTFNLNDIRKGNDEQK